MQRMRFGVGLLVFVGFAWAQASAQDGLDFRKSFGRGIDGFMLLMQKSVQKELQLSEDQIKKLEAYQTKQMERYKEPDPKERAKKLAGASVAGEKTISETLKPEQIKRFQEISRQQDGLLHSVEAKDGHVAAALKFTDDQKEKIRTIGDATGTQIARHSRPRAGTGARRRPRCKSFARAPTRRSSSS